jgi:acyl-CoA hydrolase
LSSFPAAADGAVSADFEGRLAALLRPGDSIVWSQGTAEPSPITRAIVANRHAWGPFSVFVGATFSDTLDASVADMLRISSYGAIGTTRALSDAGALDVLPNHASQLGAAIERGEIGCDVAIVQLSPPGPNGKPSLGPVNDYIRAAMRKARLIVAEVNDQLPWTYGPEPEGLDRIALTLHTSRPPVELAAKAPTDIERAIAKHAAAVIGDGATLQVGIGGTIDALLQYLGDRRDLGVHSGMIGDGILDLIEKGAITNARKAIDTGITVTGALFGSRRLMRFADRNPALVVQPYEYTHAMANLAQLRSLVAVNAAIEVDLTGQANAEMSGGRYVGGVGGQLDFMHAAKRAPEGAAIIALPSTAGGGRINRIRAMVDNVTCPRSEIDFIVTEHGCADLRDKTLRERIPRMIAIAHPDFREQLEREAHPMLQRGF